MSDARAGTRHREYITREWMRFMTEHAKTVLAVMSIGYNIETKCWCLTFYSTNISQYHLSINNVVFLQNDSRGNELEHNTSECTDRQKLQKAQVMNYKPRQICHILGTMLNTYNILPLSRHVGLYTSGRSNTVQKY